MSTNATGMAGYEIFLRKLSARIRTGDCILLLGPGVAVDESEGSLRLTTLLSRQLAADPVLQNRCAPEIQDDLRAVAQIHYQVKRDREELALAVTDFYDPRRNLTTDFHRDLAHLPFRLVVNTSFDDMMLNALQGAGKQPRRAHYNYREYRDVAPLEPPVKQPLVYYLYGDRTDLDSLVITEADLIEFLVAVVKGQPHLPPLISSRFGDKDSTFLFLGFGFEHWYLRVLLHVLKIYGHRSKAVALEDRHFFEHPEHGQAVGFFSGEREIEFRSLGWTDFARHLRELYESTQPTDEAGTSTVPPGAPRAFLCYATEDRPVVQQLNAALRHRSIDVWQDIQNLRGGNDWARELLGVIRDKADYFVVVQSPAMVRDKGYFNKEINAAIDQQLEFREGLDFVIPLRLPGAPQDPRLEKFHQIDWDGSTEQGIDRLAQAIHEDWQKRNRKRSSMQAIG